jgi:hypothetical protein
MPATSADPYEPFYSARSKAWLAGLFDRIRRHPRDMLAFGDVRAGLNVRGQRDLGRQVVLLDQIVGSEGRYSDFDRRFLPRTDLIAARWSSIEKAMVEGVDLPPVELYKVSDVYFVRDGNHRVSVARHLGRVDIDAMVTELFVDVVLSPDLSSCTLLLAHEYSDFLEWTNLHVLRPDERIGLSTLGGYLDLVRLINMHRAALAQAQNRSIPRDEAVTSWYDTSYLPLVQVIREQHLLRYCSGHTEADLYLWIMTQSERLGMDISCLLELLRDPQVAQQWMECGSWTAAIRNAMRGALQRFTISHASLGTQCD